MARAHYSADRMRSSSVRPSSVLRLDNSQTLSLNKPLRISGPVELGVPARERQLRLFNPSIVPAPVGLCTRCAFVAALRADPLHQCDATSPLTDRTKVVATNAWFKGTIIAVYDANLQMLNWTWLLIDPAKQVEARHNSRRQSNSIRSDWFVPAGAADNFAPPWSELSMDARLLDFDGKRLFVTFLRSCHAHQPCHFGASQLHLTAERIEPSGGLSSLRAWAHPTFHGKQKWAQGRNQALFAARTTQHATTPSLLVQPWPGLIASFGEPFFETRRLVCAPWAVRNTRSGKPMGGVYPVWERKANRAFCGTTPPGTQLQLEVASGRFRRSEGLSPRGGGRFGRLELLYNHSAAIAIAASSGGAAATARRIKSLTTNLIRIERVDAFGRSCAALIGVGHIHLSDGVLNQQRGGSTGGSGGVFSAAPFLFGADYQHHFYTLMPTPPFKPLAYSDDFCISSPQDENDCERVQFVSGMALVDKKGAPARKPSEGDALLLAYGVNDCEARVGRIPLGKVWEMVKPLPGETACAAF